MPTGSASRKPDAARATSRARPRCSTAGTIPLSELTHIAVTYDGTTRRHYINGELVALARPRPARSTTTSEGLRIGSDVSYDFTPNFSFSEVRLWNVARTQDQIRSPSTCGSPRRRPGWWPPGRRRDR